MLCKVADSPCSGNRGIVPRSDATQAPNSIAFAQGCHLLGLRKEMTIIWLERLRRVQDSLRLLGFACTAKFVLAKLTQVPVIRLRPRGMREWFWVRTGDSDFMVLFHVFGEKEMDIELSAPPRLIVDAGAYTGYSTYYFARRYPAARVVAVEPVPTNADMLEKHCGDLDNVTIERAALWPRLGHVSIVDPGHKSWAFQVREGAADSLTVPTITIPEILRRTGESRIDLLKLDIEGAEEALFRTGADEWLPRVGAMVIELHGPDCAKAMEDAIAGEEMHRIDRGEKVILTRSEQT